MQGDREGDKITGTIDEKFIRAVAYSILEGYRKIGADPTDYCRALENSEDYYMTQRDRATDRSDWERVARLNQKIKTLKDLEDPCW